ncbi:hypothetical protein [Thiolapillus sp.]
MKNFANDLKKIFTGFHHELNADYLSTHEKIQLLGGENKADTAQRPTKQQASPQQEIARRVAIVTDGLGLEAPLDYAIEASDNQYTQIDLLIHGAMDNSKISIMEQRVQQAGLACQRIQLGANAVEHLMDYIRRQSSLLFVVAKPDDSIARNLMYKASSKGIHRMYIPLVLIEDNKPRLSSESAA